MKQGIIPGRNRSKWIDEYKKVYTTPSYIEHFLILTSTATGCTWVSAWYSCWNYKFCNRIKNLCKNAGIKRYKSITKKKKKHNKIVLLAKSKLNCIEVLISKTFIDSVTSYDEFVLKNNVLR